MAEEAIVTDPQQVQQPYIDKVYSALKDNLQGFNKTPEQFKAAMKDSAYAAKAYNALKDNLNGFEKPQEQFYQQVGLKKKDLPNVASTTAPQLGNGLPTFQSSPQPSNIPYTPQYGDAHAQEIKQAKQTPISNQLEQNLKAYSDAQGGNVEEPDVAAPELKAYKKSSLGENASFELKSIAGSLNKGVANLVIAPLYAASNKLGLVDDNETARMLNQVSDSRKDTFGLDPNTLQHGDNMVHNAVNQFAFMAPALIIASGTGGASFGLQSAGQAATQIQKMKDNGVKFENHSDDLFILGAGLIGTALGRGSMGSVFKSLGTDAKNNIASALTADVIKELGAEGEKATGESITKAFLSKAQTLSEKVGQVGLPALTQYAKVGTEMSAANAATFGTKKLANAINGNEPFKDTTGQDFIQGIAEPFGLDKDAHGNPLTALKNIATSPAGFFGGIEGAKEGLGLLGNRPNPSIARLQEDNSPEMVDKIKQELAQHGANKGWSPNEVEQAQKGVDLLSNTVAKLPKGMPVDKVQKGISIIIGRNELDGELKKIQDEKTKLDPSVAELPTPHEELIQNKIDQANDKLRALVTSKNPTYSKGIDKEEGKYFKTIDGTKEEITPSRYNLEAMERDIKNGKDEAPKQAEPIAENGVLEAPQEVPVEKVNEEPTNNLTNTKIQEDGKNELREQQVGQESRQEGSISNEKGSTQEEAQLPAEEKVVNTGDAKAEPDIKVKDVLDKPVTYHGEPAIITQDGQTLVAKIKNSNREYELGHVDEIGEKSIKDLGIEHDNSVVKSNENGNIVVRDKEYVNNYSDPLSAINKDKDGNVVSVNLETADGKKRTFKGDVAEDIAYQIHLKELNKDNETKEQFEQFVGQHEPAKEAIVAAEDANTAEKGTVADNAEVSRKPARKRTVKAEPKQGGVNEPIPTTDSTDAKQETKGRPESEVRQVPENKGEQKTSLSEAEAKRKLELRKKFTGQLNDITRIPTLLADKDFREYAGLVFKEAAGDFKQFSKELIDSVGEKIREHLPNLFKDLGGDEKQLPKDSEATGVRNADVTQERGEDVQRTKKTKEQVEAEGKRLVDSGDVDPDDLAKSIIDKPRPVTAEEQAALLYHKTKLKNKQRELFKETTPESEAQYARNEDLIEQNRQATEIIGNETGRTLGARTDQMAEDYSRINILNRAKKANGGELDPKDEAELTARTKRVEELEAKLADREEQIRRMHENGLTDRVKRAAEREEKDAKRAITKASLRKEREGLLADLHLIAKKSLKTTGINKIPVDMVVPLTKLARNYVLDGAVTLSGVVDKIYHDLKEHVEGLEKGDISEIVKENFDKYLHEQNQIRLDRSKKAANTKLEKLKEQSITGNFEKTVNRKIQVDNDYLKIRADIKREQTLINKKIFEIENSQKSIGRKAVDFAVKWGRNSKLASIPVLGKLILTGITTMATKALTEGTGLFYSAILPKIAAKSTIEGGANVAALAKSYAKAATLGMKDAYDELNIKSGGQSDLSALYGKYIESRLPAEAADFFGHLHSAIKAPIKRQAWEYSYAKRVARQIEAGIDVHDPVTDAKNRLDAYKDAERAIFMGDNSISSAYEAAMKTLENKDSPAAKNVAALTRILLPFVKVPTNIALSSGRYAFGLIPGLGKLAQIGTSGALRAAGAEGLAKVIHSGMGELTPEESDMVLRNLKHGTVGGAVLLIGYFNPKNVGGYYQPGEKRKPSDVNAGSLKVFGHKIPVWMTEHPLFQAMQMGATFRRVLDAHKAKNDNISAAALATASGLAEAIPLANEAKNLTDMMGSDTKKFNKFISQTVKGEIEPAFLQQIALVTDTKDKSLVTFDDKNQQKRAPDKKHGLLKYMKQDLETGIPGLRKNVPKK